MAPKVSIITPIYNVERYLPRCLDSLLSQTLQDVEFICVNDGSTDRSLGILNRYAERDSRIVVIDKPNAGYGHTMNCGLDTAKGEYIGIVESDDWVKPEAFEALYDLACEHGRCDIAKANYFMCAQGEEPLFVENYPESLCKKTLSPLDENGAAVINSIPAIWSAIYRREFLENAGIRFLETPGASFQDTGFVFKCWLAADSFALMHEAFLNYRVDNAASSVKSSAKVFEVSKEFASIEAFLNAFPERRDQLLGRVLAKKFDTYNWNYERIALEHRKLFLEFIAGEFQEPFANNKLDPAAFKEGEWERLVDILLDPQAVYEADLHKHERDHLKAVIPKRVASTIARRILNATNSPTGPKASIVIPVYNADRYLDRMMKTILGQTYTNLEVICVNDGSTDSSLAKLRQYASRDERIVIVDQPNAGPSAARNNGIACATGDYLCFVDADDFVERTMMEKALSAAERYDAQVVIFGVDEYCDDIHMHLPFEHIIVKGKIPIGEVFCPRDVDNFFVNTVGFTVNKLYRMDYLRSLDIAFPVIGAHEDMPYSYAAMAAATRMFAIDEPLYHYRRDRDDGSRSDNVEGNYVYLLEAFEETRMELERLKLWNDFERDFENYVANMSQWKFALLDTDARRNFISTLKDGWLDNIGALNRDETYYYEANERSFIHNISELSYTEIIELELQRVNSDLQALLRSRSFRLMKAAAVPLNRMRGVGRSTS